jgi:hypothetical protein
MKILVFIKKLKLFRKCLNLCAPSSIGNEIKSNGLYYTILYTIILCFKQLQQKIQQHRNVQSRVEFQTVFMCSFPHINNLAAEFLTIIIAKRDRLTRYKRATNCFTG